MAYCTTAQVTAQFETAATDQAANVAGWIVISDAEIDGKLRAAGYQTPISGTVPEIVTQWSILKTGLKVLDKVYEHQNKLVDEDYVGDEDSGITEQIKYIEEAIASGKILPKIARIDMSTVHTGDSLSSPSVSQFKTPVGFDLNTPDIND